MARFLCGVVVCILVVGLAAIAAVGLVVLLLLFVIAGALANANVVWLVYPLCCWYSVSMCSCCGFSKCDFCMAGGRALLLVHVLVMVPADTSAMCLVARHCADYANYFQ